MLPRFHNWFRWLRPQGSDAPGEPQPLPDDVYLEALTSLIIASVDILVMTEIDEIPHVVLGRACLGELAGKWTPFGERMWKGDKSPQSRACKVLNRLGLDVAERSFDPVGLSFNYWDQAHYVTVMLTLNLTAKQVRQLEPDTKYEEIRLFRLKDVLQHPDVPDVYKAYITDWRNLALC